MSIPVSIIRCTGCTQEWSTHNFWGQHLYLFPDERSTFLDKIIGWCESCRELRLVESLPDKEKLYEEFIEAYDEFQKQEPHFKKTFVGALKLSGQEIVERYEINKKNLKDARAAIEWLKNRTSKPKCLTCGSNDIMDVKNFQSTVVHPHCGGVLSLEATDVCFSVRRKQRIYDPEGNFLQEK